MITSYLFFFNDGKLNKIVGNKEKTKYNFYISLIETLPIDIYTNFIDALKNHFKNYHFKSKLKSFFGKFSSKKKKKDKKDEK